jgi:hypothetical protein
MLEFGNVESAGTLNLYVRSAFAEYLKITLETIPEVSSTLRPDVSSADAGVFIIARTDAQCLITVQHFLPKTSITSNTLC